MDSREIAELTGKNHADVCRDIRGMLEKLGEIDQSRFASVYKAGNGEARTCYRLPYRETMILVSGYSVELRAKIIDRWQELEAGVKAIARTSSALLAAINRAHDRKILTTAEARELLGLPYAVTETQPIAITSDIGPISKQAYAVEMKQRQSAKDKAARDKIQGKLL